MEGPWVSRLPWPFDFNESDWCTPNVDLIVGSGPQVDKPDFTVQFRLQAKRLGDGSNERLRRATQLVLRLSWTPQSRRDLRAKLRDGCGDSSLPALSRQQTTHAATSLYTSRSSQPSRLSGLCGGVECGEQGVWE